MTKCKPAYCGGAMTNCRGRRLSLPEMLVWTFGGYLFIGRLAW